MSANPAPGFTKYPEHRVSIERAGARVRVSYKGEVIAESRDAVRMNETKEGSVLAPVVYYIPRKDVKMEKLVRTDHSSYCPFKGKASYYSFKDGPENAVWSYETPYDELSAIKELLAFYPDKVDSIAALPER